MTNVSCLIFFWFSLIMRQMPSSDLQTFLDRISLEAQESICQTNELLVLVRGDGTRLVRYHIISDANSFLSVRTLRYSWASIFEYRRLRYPLVGYCQYWNCARSNNDIFYVSCLIFLGFINIAPNCPSFDLEIFRCIEFFELYLISSRTALLCCFPFKWTCCELRQLPSFSIMIFLCAQSSRHCNKFANVDPSMTSIALPTAKL